MGLDITAYRKLEPAPDAEVDSNGYPVEYNRFLRIGQGTLDWTEKNWPGRSTGVTAGIYTAAEQHKFRAGSYHGYNLWRDALCRFALGKSADEFWEGPTAGPFVELIDFPDNEGVIGPAISAKLAKDFAEFEPKAIEHAEKIADGHWWLESYRNWKRAFEMAADDGAVDFH